MGAQERRVHARIETDLPCVVRNEDGAFEARLRNLSRAGAAVVGPPGVGKLGDAVELEMELPGFSEPVGVLTEIIRTELCPPGFRFGLRFVLVEPRQREHLGHFLEALLERQGAGSRAHPRVYPHLEVVCTTAAQTRAMMNNVSQGGLALECDLPLVLDEPVTIGVHLGDEAAQLELRGHVVHVRSIGEHRYHAGIRFSPLSGSEEAALRDLMAALLAGKQ